MFYGIFILRDTPEHQYLKPFDIKTYCTIPGECHNSLFLDLLNDQRILLSERLESALFRYEECIKVKTEQNHSVCKIYC